MAPSRCPKCGNLARFCTCDKGPLPTGPTPFEVQYDRLKSTLRADEVPNPQHFVVDALGGDPETDGIYLCERGCGLTIQGECAYGGFHLDPGRDDVTHLVVRTALPEHARPTSFYLTLLDPLDLEADTWGLTVRDTGGCWGIFRTQFFGGARDVSLGRDETWAFPPTEGDDSDSPGGRYIPTDEDWATFRAGYRWDNAPEALAFAEAYLPRLTINGLTTEGLIADRASRGVPTPWLKEHLG